MKLLINFGLLFGILASSSANAQNLIAQEEDTIPMNVCGDLHTFSDDLQNDYVDFKLGLPSSMKAAGTLDPSATFQCGSFTVYYEDFLANPPLGGFADPVEGQARRDALCDVLTYVEDVLDINPDANPTIQVLQSFYSPGNEADPGTAFLGRAGAIYSDDFQSVQGVYNGHFMNYILTGNDPDPEAAFDGVLQMNFHETNVFSTQPVVYFIDENNPPNQRIYSLKTVLLHEITHMLGVASQLGEDLSGNLVCVNSNDSYTRYDWNTLYFGDILNPATFSSNKMVIGENESSAQLNPTINGTNYPLRQAKVWLYDEGPPNNHIVFAGIPGASESSAVYNSVSSSFISHLGTYNRALSNRQQFSPGRYQEYVMEPTLFHQQIKSEWSLPEIRLLLNLGYSLNPSFAVSNSLNPNFTNSQVINNSPPYRTDYNIYNEMVTPYPSTNFVQALETNPADFGLVNSNTLDDPTATSLTINLASDASFADPDNETIYTSDDLIFGIRGVGDGNGNNHNQLTLSQNGQVFTYTPLPGFSGRAEFGFFLTDGKEIGAVEVYTIDVTLDPNIASFGMDEMVINGSFEDGIEVKTWEDPDKVYTSAKYVNFQAQLFYGMSGVGGGHPFSFSRNAYVKHSLDNWSNYDLVGVDNGFGVYGSWSTAAPNDFVVPTPTFSNSTTNNNRYVRHGDIISALRYPLVPGEFYELSFEAAGVDPDLSNTPFLFLPGDEITVEFEVIEDLTDPDSYTVVQSIPLNITIETLVSPWAETDWQDVSFVFQYCGTEDAFLIRSDIPGFLPALYVDNLSIHPAAEPPILTVEAGDDISVFSSCTPGQGQLNAIPSYEACQLIYSWSPSNGLSDPNIQNPIASPSSTTIYTVTVTNPLTNEVATDDITVWVDQIENTTEINLCIDDGIINLHDYTFLDGGVFFVNFSEIDGYFFDPQDYGYGSYNIYYEYESTNCVLTGDFIVNVQGYDASNASNPNGLTVSTTQTFNGDYQFLDDLIIEDGAIATFSGSEMQFSEGKGIDILPGGRLILNNCILKELDCGTHWKGIYVHGNSSFSQYGSESNFQGKLVLKYSSLSNAKHGVVNHNFANPGSGPGSTFGGIIYVEGSEFINCETSALVKNYQNIHPVLDFQLPIQCDFYNTDFLWDEEYQFINSLNNPMIELQSVNQVTIWGCSFLNLHPDIFVYPNNSPDKAAIYSIKASIDMRSGCNGSPPYAFNTDGTCFTGDVPSTVEGFNYGIRLIEASASSIAKTSFKCYRGIWATHGKGFRMTQNYFYNLPSDFIPLSGNDNVFDPVWQVSYGAYLQSITLMWVEANNFNFPFANSDAGLIINNSGANFNTIYDNSFTNLLYADVAYDDNRGLSENSGLKYECNDFSGNLIDIVTYPTISNPPTGWGIAQWQGFPGNIDNPSESAGNQYLSNSIYNLANTLDPVAYFTTTGENFLTYLGASPFNVSNDNECQSSFPSLFGKTELVADYKSSSDSISTALETIIDDGDTEALTIEVVLADFNEAAELYFELMDVSPNLSEQVMIEAINKEYDLPSSLLTIILQSNPHAAKSGKVQKELDERSMPLEEYQRAMVDEGLELVSYKEGLEAYRSYLDNRYLFILNQIIYDILSDDTEDDKITAIESAIQGYETVDHYYLLVDLLVDAEKISDAEAKLNQIGIVFNLDPRRNAEYMDYMNVYSIIFDKVESGSQTLTTSEFDQLETIALKNSTMAAGLALATLKEYADYFFIEPLIEPDYQGKSNKARNHRAKVPMLSDIKVYPNPASDIVLANIPSEYETVRVLIFDSNGRQVKSLNAGTGIVTFNVSDLDSGTYIIQIFKQNGGKPLKNEVIEIVR